MIFKWDDKKNKDLKSKGRPSFEDAIQAMSENGVLIDDLNPAHSGQRIYVVSINGYPHTVPYEIRKNEYWLITVYPTRKYKKVMYGKKV